MKRTKCPYCGKSARLATHVARFRRGDRVLPVEVQHWECTGVHPGPDGEVPFRFEDAELLKRNDDAARQAWLERFGEPMPAAARPGRKPEEPRNNRITVLLTSSEVARLDEERGAEPRAEYVRKRLFAS